MTTKTETLFKLCNTSGGCTSPEASLITGDTLVNVSGPMSRLWRLGRVSRKVERLLPTGRPTYRYFPADAEGCEMAPEEVAPTEPKPRRRRRKDEERVEKQAYDAYVAGEARRAEQGGWENNCNTVIEKVLQSSPIGKPATPEPLDFNTVVANLVDALTNAVVAQLHTRLASRIQELLPTVHRVIHPPLYDAAVPVRLPKILIVGLLPQQAGMIAQEFGEAYDLRFWKEGNPKELDANTKTADGVYVLITMVSHWMTEKLKGTKYIPVSGMDNLRTKLTERFVTEGAG